MIMTSLRVRVGLGRLSLASYNRSLVPNDHIVSKSIGLHFYLLNLL